jgi:hypothetical protein
VAKAQVSAHTPSIHPIQSHPIIPQKGKEGAEGETQAEGGNGNGTGTGNGSSSSPVPEEAAGENKPKAKDDDASDASRSILSKVCTVEVASIYAERPVQSILALALTRCSHRTTPRRHCIGSA